jgi:pimeloyl-ACP methyl ester carboxylesterase
VAIEIDLAFDAAPRGLLMFVHGLGGEARATWGGFPRLIADDAELSAAFEVAYFGYPTTLFGLPLFTPRPPSIQDLAQALRSQVDIRHREAGDVVLVCHSLGGLIARKYLIEEAKAGRPLRVRRLMLFDVPNTGAELAALASLIRWRHNQLRQLCRRADFMEFLNADWVSLKMDTRLAVQYVTATQDRVVARESAMQYWGNPNVATIAGHGHLSVVKPTRATDDAFVFLKAFALGR